MKRVHLKILKNGMVAAVIFCLSAVSCIKDSPAPGKSVKGGKGEASVTFSLKLPANATPGTRTLNPAQESSIETVEVLVFKSGGDPKYSYTTYGVVNGTSVTVNLVKSADANDKYDLVLLANMRSEVMGQNFVTTDSKETVLKALTKTVSGKWNAAATGYTHLPMSSDPEAATLTGQVISEGMSRTVHLHRALARVNVELSMKNEVPASKSFKLTSVRVYNYNTKGAAVPYGTGWGAHTETDTYTDPTNTFRVLTPTVPDQATLKGPLVYRAEDSEVTAEYCKNEIYIFEVENHETGGHTVSKELTERSCIVIGGIYDATGKGVFDDDADPVFYRVDFADASQKSLDVLRNHSYNFKIRAITGPGFKDEEDAFKSLPMNIDADVVEWNEWEIGDIEIYGNTYFGIQRREVEFSAFGNQIETVKIKTNIPDFSLSLDGTKRLQANDPDYDEYDNANFSYTLKKTDDDLYTLTIITKSAHISASQQDDRIDKWDIKARYIDNISFKVTQLWGTTYISVVDGHSSRLYPEGTNGVPIPINIISHVPVSVVVDYVSGGTGWLSGISTPVLNDGVYSAQMKLTVPVFKYGESNDGTENRTATVTITPENGEPVVYTITQEAPYLLFNRSNIYVTRPLTPLTTSTSVTVTTNLLTADLLLARGAGTGTGNDYITLERSLYSYDAVRPRDQRFDVALDLTATPLPTNGFSAPFTVSLQSSGKYGDLSPITISVTVPSTSDVFKFFWYRGFDGITNSWTWAPARYSEGTNVTEELDGYIFPWNMTEVQFDVVSNLGLAENSEMSVKHDGTLTTNGSQSKNIDGDIQYPYSFLFNNTSYSTPRQYTLAFNSSPAGTDGSLKFGQGQQVWKRTDFPNDGTLGYAGYTSSTPAVVDVTSNVKWGIAVVDWDPAIPDGGEWLKVRFGTSGTFEAPASVDKKTKDDRLTAPVQYKYDTYLSDPTSVLTKLDPTAVQTTITPLGLNAHADNDYKRSATILFGNLDYDDTKGGAATPPITITQYAPALYPTAPTFNDLPLEYISVDGGTYTFHAKANLAGCHVRVYAASSLLGSGSFIADDGVFPSSGAGEAIGTTATVTVPVTTVTRTLTFTFHYPGVTTSKALELEVSEMPQKYFFPAYPGVIGYDPVTRKLTIDGTGIMVYFKYGGIIAMYSGGNYTPDAAWNGAASIAFNPTGITIDGYSSFPDGNSGDITVGNENITGTFLSVNNALKGNGDPCYLIGMTAEEVKSKLDNDEFPNQGEWRLPTHAENGTVGLANTGVTIWETNASPSALLDPRNGRNLTNLDNGGLTTFLPAAGVRVTTGNISGQGILARYWSSTANGSYGRVLSFTNNTVNRDYFEQSTGYPVRCVRNLGPHYLTATRLDEGKVDGIGTVEERSATFEVETNVYAGWTATVSGSATLSATSGVTGKTTVKLTFASNPNYSERSATVTFKAPDATDVSVTVTQLPATPLAAPGVIGYIKGTNTLTLAGSKEYAGTDVALNSEFGPLSTETVYVAYFKWGSLIALGSEGGNGDPFGSEDVICGPDEYDLGELKRKIDSETTANAKWAAVPHNSNIDGWPSDPDNGRGDPCAYYSEFFGNGWRLPTMRISTSPSSYSWHGGADEDGPFGSVPSTANSLTWLNTPGARWYNVGAETPMTGAVAGDGSGGQNWSMFLPAAGYRSYSGGAVMYQSSEGQYWSSTSNGSSSFFLTVSSSYVRPSDTTGSAYSYGVRCVRQE